MKLTELFAQADPAFGEAMNTLLESFHHSDDSQAPISATCSPISSINPACLLSANLSRSIWRGWLLWCPAPRTSPRHATWVI